MDSKNTIIEERLTSLLPDRPEALNNPGMPAVNRAKCIEQAASNISARQNAKELAKIKYKEKCRLKTMEKKQEKNEALAKELGLEEVPLGQTEHQAREIAAQRDKLNTLKAIEEQTVEPLSVTEVAPVPNMNHILQLQGTTRPEVLKLLTSLNINLSIQLTKQDTANLLACLLTCNEAQLAALYNNKKIPIAVKTVIKRLQEDAKFGNIETIEKLWDRVFGKGQMQLNLPEQQQLQIGIIPNVPVSREAYIVIRDTLLK